jgi:hypothetical protein
VVISQHVQNIDGYNDDEIKLIRKLLEHQYVAGDSMVPPPVVPPLPIAAGEIAGIPRVSKKKVKKSRKKNSGGSSVVVNPSTSSSEGAAGATGAPPAGSEGATGAPPAPDISTPSVSPPVPTNREGVREAKRTRSKSRKLREDEASQLTSKPQVNVVCEVPTVGIIGVPL